MAWNETKPYVTALGAAVRAGVQKIGKKGKPRATITLNVDMHERLGDPKKCNVFIGDGDELGQVLIQCDDDGMHDFRKLTRGGVLLRLNALSGMPERPMKPAGVRYEVGESDAKVALLTVWLPW